MDEELLNNLLASGIEPSTAAEASIEEEDNGKPSGCFAVVLVALVIVVALVA